MHKEDSATAAALKEEAEGRSFQSRNTAGKELVSKKIETSALTLQESIICHNPDKQNLSPLRTPGRTQLSYTLIAV